MGANSTELTRYVEGALPKIEAAMSTLLSKYMQPTDFVRLATATALRNPDVLKCNPATIVQAIVDAAAMGLQPGYGSLAHGYLVAYKGTCQFITSAPGLVEIARRSGQFLSIDAEVVRERDEFSYSIGFTGHFEHKPYIGLEDPGRIVAAYCLARFRNGEQRLKVMPIREINKRRDASPAANSSYSPWRNWFDEMAIKTVIKNAAKLWPKIPELERALQHDDIAEGFQAPDPIDADEPLQTDAMRPALHAPRRRGRPSNAERAARATQPPAANVDPEPPPVEPQDMPESFRPFVESPAAAEPVVSDVYAETITAIHTATSLHDLAHAAALAEGIESDSERGNARALFKQKRAALTPAEERGAATRAELAAKLRA